MFASPEIQYVYNFDFNNASVNVLIMCKTDLTNHIITIRIHNTDYYRPTYTKSIYF